MDALSSNSVSGVAPRLEITISEATLEYGRRSHLMEDGFAGIPEILLLAIESGFLLEEGEPVVAFCTTRLNELIEDEEREWRDLLTAEGDVFARSISSESRRTRLGEGPGRLRARC